MCEYVLKTENLGISFGGLKAVDNVNLKIKKNQIYGLIGPNGAGKTTVFNILTGVYQPTGGTFYLCGEELKGFAQDKINQKGIARTFQNIRLFNNMTVIRNVMVGFHNLPEYKCNFIDSIFRSKRHRETEKAMRARAKEILSIFGRTRKLVPQERPCPDSRNDEGFLLQYSWNFGGFDDRQPRFL